MRNKLINEELNASVERLNQYLNDEFINQCVERHKQEQTQKRQENAETSAAEKPRTLPSDN